MQTNKSDEELMLAYQLGDELAFNHLYERHSPRVLGYLRAKLRDEAKANDVFQATFLKLHKSRNRYDASLPFSPWIFTVCRSVLLDYLKKEKLILEDSTAAVPEINMSEADEASPIDFSSLSEKQIKALQLRHEQGQNFDEIARALDTSPANVRQIISRSIKQLRILYGKK